MSKWTWTAVLGGGLMVAGLTAGVGLDPSRADHHKPGEAAGATDAQAQREVDLRVIADPGHEKMNLKAPEQFEALFKTTAGDFTIKVTRAWAPTGADRFYSLVKNGYYDGNRFFRVVPDFVVQWGIHGNPEVNKAWYDEQNEKVVNLKDDTVKQSNTRGRVTFANAGPNTRSTQLFINLGDNKFLDDPKQMRGSVFSPMGEIDAAGMKVVEKLYKGYGEPPPNLQPLMVEHGESIIKEYFPKLDAVVTATIVEPQAQKAEEKAE